ncbi:MAG: PIN domain-containing protein [Acidobacteriota bacterium]
MKLDDIKSGEKIFIDSNIFIYHFSGVSKSCKEFLIRCETGEVYGFVSINILLEVMHKLMLAEALYKKLITPGNLVHKLRENPDIGKKLSEYQKNTMNILEMGVEVILFHEEILEMSFEFRRDYGLLVNDSITSAMMKNSGILNIASSDKDFERVKTFKVYPPSDV